jgi:hypothetical protein
MSISSPLTRLWDADNNRLRSPLEAAINDVVRQDLPVRYAYVPAGDATAEPGVIRNRSVASPPDAEGLVRVVEILGLGGVEALEQEDDHRAEVLSGFELTDQPLGGRTGF